MELNINQKKIILGIIILIALMSLIPPWKQVLDTRNSTKSIYSEQPIGYRPIFWPPQGEENYYGIKIDFSRLFLQWFIVLLFGAPTVYIFKNKEGSHMPNNLKKPFDRAAADEWIKNYLAEKNKKQ